MPDVPPAADAAAAVADGVAKLYLDDATGEMVSKTELKKRQKKREKDSQKEAKEAEKAQKAQAAGTSQPSFKSATAGEKDLTPNQV